MRSTRLAVVLIVFMLAVAIGGCSSGGENGESGGEESGTALALDELYDEVRKGARLILEMEAAFVGTVENTTSSTLQNVRVEVHLSNGIELGPVMLGDLVPGAMEDVEVPVTLEALAMSFNSWTPHAEVGPESGGESSGEHGPSGENGGEESGTALALDELYDEVRKGARLILEMEAAFVGTVENTTSSTLQNVRVEVHLSNGIELGPVMLGDLVPGAMEDVEVPVTLEALAMPFNGWTPHAEVGPGGGSGEHGPGGESGGG